MARGAGVSPFTLANTNNNAVQQNHSMKMPQKLNLGIQHLPTMIPSVGPSSHHCRNSGPGSLSQHGQHPQLPSLSELTAGLPAFAHTLQKVPHGPPSSASSPYLDYPSCRSLPLAGSPQKRPSTTYPFQQSEAAHNANSRLKPFRRQEATFPTARRPMSGTAR